MPVIKLSAGDLPQHFLREHERRVAEVVKAVQQAVETAGPGIAQEELRKATARRSAPINTGEYARSWQAKKLDNGAVIFNDAPYAAIIENGRRPGSRPPPSDVIFKWLEQKLRGQVKNRRDRVKAAKGMAFVIARAIGKRGLPAHRVMARTRVRLNRLVQAEVAGVLSSMRD
jgi:bacteriophage HK97-gp10 putative tail-component